MRNKEFGTQGFADYLRERATEEAKAEEFHPAEHTFWMAADRLEDFEDMLSCLDDNGEPSRDAVAAILGKLARQLNHGKYEYQFDMSRDK